MNFEWDENKRVSNLEKHGIDFADAITVLEDENRISKIDKRYDYGEVRIKLSGKCREDLFLQLFIQIETII